MKKESTFWLVWNPGGGSPTMRHPTYESAVAEARRLAESNASARFYVLSASDVFFKDSVRHESLSKPYVYANEMPFA